MLAGLSNEEHVFFMSENTIFVSQSLIGVVYTPVKNYTN